MADTTTQRQYQIYVRDYVDWWNKNEFDLRVQDPQRTPIPALPITPAKVVHFLNYTMKRPKVTPLLSSCIFVSETHLFSSVLQQA